MSDVVATSLLEVLGRTTLWLAMVALLTGIVLRFARPSWPLAQRAAWLLVLLVGWTFLRFPLDLPWYEAERVAPASISAHAAFAEQAPAESIAVIELNTLVAAPIESAVAAKSAAVAEPLGPAEVANASGQEIQRPLETPAWSAVWKPRAAMALLAAWLLGVVVLPAVWLVGYVRFLRSLESRVPADDFWASEWQALLAEAGVRRQIPLSMTDDLGPLLCRLPRGYELVVSEPLWRELDAQERRAILRHELAHYRRGDVWSSLAARFLALPHWFNPASWWAVSRFDEAAEWACDRAAVSQGETTEYAKVLMRLGQVVGHDRVYGSAARGRSLARRIRRVLTAPATADSTLKKASLVLVGLMLAAASVVQLELVAKQQTDDSSAKVAENGAREDAAAPKDENAAPKESASEPAPEAKKVEGSTDYELQIVDVKIKISQLEGQINQTELNLNLTHSAVSKLIKLNQGKEGVVPLSEIERVQGEAQKARLQLESLAEQLKLHEHKLELLNARAQGSAKNSGANAGKAVEVRAVPERVQLEARLIEDHEAGAVVPAGQQGPTPQATKQKLRYDGKGFSQWQEIAKTELSPERKTEAIRAMAAFGANGFGSEAVAQIVETARGYSALAIAKGISNSPEAKLISAALNGLARIPLKVSLPVLTKFLTDDNEYDRMLALMSLYMVAGNLSGQSPASTEIYSHADQQAFEGMLKDPKVVAALEEMEKSKDAKDDRITSMARSLLIRINPTYPKPPPPR